MPRAINEYCHLYLFYKLFTLTLMFSSHHDYLVLANSNAQRQQIYQWDRFISNIKRVIVQKHQIPLNVKQFFKEYNPKPHR